MIENIESKTYKELKDIETELENLFAFYDQSRKPLNHQELLICDIIKADLESVKKEIAAVLEDKAKIDELKKDLEDTKKAEESNREAYRANISKTGTPEEIELLNEEEMELVSFGSYLVNEIKSLEKRIARAEEVDALEKSTQPGV